MTEELEILYRDDFFVAINKPNGLMVHRSSIASDVQVFALQMLRDQTGRYVYPVHRLDRKTSGILLFAFDKETTKILQKGIECKSTIKEYTAITRGYFPDKITVDYPLINDKGKKREACTKFELIETTEIPVALGKHQTSRYSLIKAFPQTGRMHQIRKHCNHLRHPIIGDRPHGCSKQNRMFKKKWEMTNMLLHASRMTLIHPFEENIVELHASFPKKFLQMKQVLSFEK